MVAHPPLCVNLSTQSRHQQNDRITGRDAGNRAETENEENIEFTTSIEAQEKTIGITIGTEPKRGRSEIKLLGHPIAFSFMERTSQKNARTHITETLWNGEYCDSWLVLYYQLNA